jgi:hypothetical protein
LQRHIAELPPGKDTRFRLAMTFLSKPLDLLLQVFGHFLG